MTKSEVRRCKKHKRDELYCPDCKPDLRYCPKCRKERGPIFWLDGKRECSICGTTLTDRPRPDDVCERCGHDKSDHTPSRNNFMCGKCPCFVPKQPPPNDTLVRALVSYMTDAQLVAFAGEAVYHFEELTSDERKVIYETLDRTEVLAALGEAVSGSRLPACTGWNTRATTGTMKSTD